MELPVFFVFTHDSIGVGEDGPTHQPIEQLAALRAMPNINVVRPADAHETALAWSFALRASETPTVLALSRQGLVVLDPELIPADAIERGGYILRDCDGAPAVVLIGTGSEVAPVPRRRPSSCRRKGIATRVVSMPCMDRFEASRPPSASACSGRRGRRASPSRLPARSAGTAGSASAAR